MYNAQEIINQGFTCLVEKLGIIGTEHFIAELSRQKIDYTTWRRTVFDDMTLEEINKEAVEYAKAHPYKGKGKKI